LLDQACLVAFAAAVFQIVAANSNTSRIEERYTLTKKEGINTIATKILRKNGSRTPCLFHPVYRPHRVTSKKIRTKGKSIRSLIRKPRPIAVSGAITTDTPRQHKEANSVPKIGQGGMVYGYHFFLVFL